MLDKISQDMKEAMKAKDRARLDALRYLKSLLMENKTSKKPGEELDVLTRHVKKLKESLEMFPEGSEQHQKTIAELNVMEDYLPQPLSEEEVRQLIADIKSGLDTPQMGAIMKELTPKIKGRFEGKRASELVKEALS